MVELKIENAKITNVSLTMEDFGCLTFWITIEGAGWGCNIGGYNIGHGYLGADEFCGYGPGIEAIMRIMDTVGVSKWEDLEGQYIRVKTEGRCGTINCIGNVLKNKWFDLKDFFVKAQTQDNY